jgi:phosphoglycerate-specific signal transduction histidine kinase
MKKTLREQLDTAEKKYAKQEAAGDEQVEDAFFYGAKWWQRNAAKSLKEYEHDLTKAHEEVIGNVTYAIKIQIRRVARIWEKVDRLHDELDMEDSFMRWGQGSMKQNTENPDQRLSILEKWERTLESALTSIGLTYNTTPSKVKDDKKKGVDAEKAGLTSLINSAQNEVTDIPDIDS